MTLTTTAEWPQTLTILDLADMIRRDGSGVYTDGGIAGCVYQASLCGLTAAYGRGGNVILLKGHNLHVMIDLRETVIDEGGEIDHNSATRLIVFADYLKGDADVLDAWHRHLSAYRRSMWPGRDVSAVAS